MKTVFLCVQKDSKRKPLLFVSYLPLFGTKDIGCENGFNRQIHTRKIVDGCYTKAN